MKSKLLALFLLTSSLIFGNEEINRDQLSETLGHLIVRHLANPGFDFNLDKIITGMQDEREGKACPMTEEEYEQAIYAIQESLFLKTAETNLAKAAEFLKENSAKEGVQAIDEKLQYKIAQEGLGEEVGPESTPLIHYKGSLLDGSVFSSSLEGQQPVALPIKQTIPGFAKGLLGMKEGEKRILYVHPELAYGLSGHLPPNSLLIFEVEVVKADSPKEMNPSEIASSDADSREIASQDEPKVEETPR